jgi:two-component system chemotaxis response regulator CheB
MPRTRVLIVDDSIVCRRALADELGRDGELEVAGAAANGRIALAMLTQVNPDVVILDIEMPEMDGLTALKELRKTHPRLPVIMFSALTERGAAATLDALALGATDYFTKPSNAEGLESSLQVIRTELIPEIKAICARKDAVLKPVALPPARPATPAEIQVLAIGTSTGGPNALTEVLAGLAAGFPVPTVIVQHMPPMFTRLLAERLNAHGPLRVQEGRPGAILQPGEVWIAPGDHHMTVVRAGPSVRLELNQDPLENSCRPAVDVLLRSVAKAYGNKCLSVILTGMGKDGLRGCEIMRELGGQILAQDEESSVVWGMPGYVARAGLADKVLPLSMMAGEIVRRVSRPKASG